MWIPVRLIPRRVISDSWSRHLAARFACSGMVVSMVLLWPGGMAALGALLDSECLFQSLLGLPCPGCGITTSLLALARGEWQLAMNANPAGPAIVALLIAQMFPALRQFVKPSHNVGSQFIGAFDVFAIVMLCMVWGTRLVHLGMA